MNIIFYVHYLNLSAKIIINFNILWKFEKKVYLCRVKQVSRIIMTIYGLLCGLKDFTNIADFMKLKEDYFTKLLNLENGTP